jgi:outer membrane lipoprotein SlyB
LKGHRLPEQVKEDAMTAGTLLLTIPAIAVIAGGCAYSASGQSYPRHETRAAYTVEYGEVVTTRVVEIEGEPSVIGVWGGASVGSTVGGSSTARAVGGVAGAVAGQAIERKIAAADGLEITILLDRSDTIAVVQAADVEFAPGDRVRVLFGTFGEARVTPL